MHEAFLQRSVDIASDGVRFGQGGPYGAVIVKDGRIIAESGNLVTQRLDPTAHAEISAIRQACLSLQSFQLVGCTLYCSCEPCPMCLGAIYWSRLDRVFFACSRDDAADAGFDDKFIYEQLDLAPVQRSIVMTQLEIPEAALPFRLWRQKVDKVFY